MNLLKNPLRWRNEGYCFLLFLALALLYNAYFLGFFFSWDDTRFIYQAREVMHGRSSIFSPVEGCLRPTCLLYFSPLTLISTTAPLVYRLGGVLIHATVAFVFYLVIQGFFRHRSLALLSALIFLFKGDQVEAYYNIAGIGHPLSLLSGLLSFYFYFKFLEPKPPRKAGFYLLSLLFFALGMGAKETGLMAIVFIAFLHLSRTRRLKETAVYLLPYLGISLSFFTAVFFAQKKYSGLTGYIEETSALPLQRLLRLLNSWGYGFVPHAWADFLGRNHGLLAVTLIVMIATLLWHRRRPSLWSKALLFCTIGHFVLQIPFLFVGYGVDYLISRHLYHGNLLLALFWGILIVTAWDQRKRLPARWARWSFVLPGVFLSIWLYSQSRIHREVISAWLNLHKTRETETIFWALYGQRELLNQVGWVYFLNAPYAKLFNLQFAITSLVRLIGPNHLLATAVQFELQPGDQYLWFGADGVRKMGELQIKGLRSDTQFMQELMAPPAQEIPLPNEVLLVHWLPQTQSVYFALSRRAP